jgi:TM2 domain-containing membrane protein YozV
MFCRNCNNEVSEKAIICVACGTPPKLGDKYCWNCNSSTNPNAEICLKCGVGLKNQNTENKDWLTTLILCFFLGYFGVHRFYTKHIGIGVAQLLTGGGCGIWALVDFIMILTGSYKDADGNQLIKK